MWLQAQLQNNHEQSDLWERVCDLRHNSWFSLTLSFPEKVMNFTFDRQNKDSMRIWCFKLDNCWFDIPAFWTSHALHVRIFCVFVFHLSSMCLYPCIVCLSSSCQYNSTLLVKPAEVCLLGERPIVTCLCSRSFAFGAHFHLLLHCNFVHILFFCLCCSI